TRHSTHRAAQVCSLPQEHPGRSRTAALLPPLESRTTLRLASQLPATGQPLGISRSQFPRHASARLPRHPSEAFMRWLLVPEIVRCARSVFRDKSTVALTQISLQKLATLHRPQRQTCVSETRFFGSGWRTPKKIFAIHERISMNIKNISKSLLLGASLFL